MNEYLTVQSVLPGQWANEASQQQHASVHSHCKQKRITLYISKIETNVWN